MSTGFSKLMVRMLLARRALVSISSASNSTRRAKPFSTVTLISPLIGWAVPWAFAWAVAWAPPWAAAGRGGASAAIAMTASSSKRTALARP
jgi:hypothetical protein